MDRRAISVAKVAGIVGVIVAPLAIHAAIATSAWPALIVILPVLQLLILGIAAVIHHPARIKWLVGAVVVLTGALVWAEKSGLSLAAVPGIPHALAYSALLSVFGYSLLPGHEPILTRAVNAVRGPLPPQLIVHTRHATWAWCFFFAAQLVVSGALFLLAPLAVWSFFINILNLPLVLLMFGLEAGYRMLKYRDFPRDSLSDIRRVAAKIMGNHSRRAETARVLLPFNPSLSSYDDHLPADPS
jgi:uncharacterized membrane protein